MDHWRGLFLELEKANAELEQQNKNLSNEVFRQDGIIVTKADSLYQQNELLRQKILFIGQLNEKLNRQLAYAVELEREQAKHSALLAAYETEVEYLCPLAERTEAAEKDSFQKDIYVLGMTLLGWSIFVLFIFKKISKPKRSPRPPPQKYKFRISS